jgi:hypothetical protein
VATYYEVQYVGSGGSTYATWSGNVSGTSVAFNGASGSWFFRVRGYNADNLPGEWGYQQNAPGGGGGGSGLAWSSVPASATASGTAGALAYDSEYLYVAVGSSQWKRAALSTWTVPAITIGTQPSNQTASSGAATFSVSASVTQSASLSYQWQRSTDSGSTFTAISGATSNSLSLTGLVSGDNNNRYRVVVSATGGATSVTSSAATLTVGASASITYANKYGTGTHSVSGTSIITASITGGGDLTETRLWLLIGQSGTLSYTVTASSEAGYDGGRLHITSASPASFTGVEAYDLSPIDGLTNVSAAVSGTQSSSGTVSVTAGQYLVLRYAKDESSSAGSDRITATLSIA